MKTKFLFICVAVLILSVITGLSVNGQKTSFAIQAGANFQNLNGKDAGGDKLENSIAPGFHAGVNVIVPVAPDFYFQPGLQFSRKGAKNTSGLSDIKYNISYVELPLNLLYRGQLGNGYVLLGFGPYVGYAVKAVEVVGDVDADMDLKAFDAGAGVYAGYETGMGIYFQLNTQYGLLNLSTKDDDSLWRNVGFGLSLGYRF
ncbi:MAG TPA: PorT family protein [Bacteroidaceae bacterium]|nr:PorT family protein [Bacteroidaceae bacterium]